MYVPHLLEAGRWLKRYDEAFYGTHGGPYFGQDWGVSTFRDNKVYLFLRELKGGELAIASLNLKLLSVRMQMDKDEISFRQERDTIRLKLPEYVPGTLNQVLVLEYNSSLEATR
jgi:alpha-L-fucosidase